MGTGEDPLTPAPTAIPTSQDLRKEAGYIVTEEQAVRISGKG